jgi:hypothetical protein
MDEDESTQHDAEKNQDIQHIRASGLIGGPQVQAEPPLIEQRLSRLDRVCFKFNANI